MTLLCFKILVLIEKKKCFLFDINKTIIYTTTFLLIYIFKKNHKPQSKEAGIRTLVALDDQGGESQQYYIFLKIIYYFKTHFYNNLIF